MLLFFSLVASLPVSVLVYMATMSDWWAGTSMVLTVALGAVLQITKKGGHD